MSFGYRFSIIPGNRLRTRNIYLSRGLTSIGSWKENSRIGSHGPICIDITDAREDFSDVEKCYGTKNEYATRVIHDRTEKYMWNYCICYWELTLNLATVWMHGGKQNTLEEIFKFSKYYAIFSDLKITHNVIWKEEM